MQNNINGKSFELVDLGVSKSTNFGGKREKKKNLSNFSIDNRQVVQFLLLPLWIHSKVYTGLDKVNAFKKGGAACQWSGGTPNFMSTPLNAQIDTFKYPALAGPNDKKDLPFHNTKYSYSSNKSNYSLIETVPFHKIFWGKRSFDGFMANTKSNSKQQRPSKKNINQFQFLGKGLPVPVPVPAPAPAPAPHRPMPLTPAPAKSPARSSAC